MNEWMMNDERMTEWMNEWWMNELNAIRWFDCMMLYIIQTGEDNSLNTNQR